MVFVGLPYCAATIVLQGLLRDPRSKCGRIDHERKRSYYPEILQLNGASRAVEMRLRPSVDSRLKCDNEI